MRQIEILDTSLRDGAQGEGISFSVNDKFAVLAALTELGIRYVECGNPGSNPKDREFFTLWQARAGVGSARADGAGSGRPGSGGVSADGGQATLLAAFGSTRRKQTDPADDAGLRDLLNAGTPVTVIFGKVWDLEVREILRTTEAENLAMIRDSCAFLRDAGREVIFDAEHYFEAAAANPEYAHQCLQAAAAGGAAVVCLCDTNGATLPEAIARETETVCALLPEIRIGIHTHNDSGLAVAGTLAAVLAGATHVQGTMNGIGERCGNANLATIIPNLQLKYGYPCLPPEKLRQLTPIARRLADIANLTLPSGDPYVGTSAFSHKGGMHVDGVKKNPWTFEHVEPETVGNTRRFLYSEVSGRSAVLDLVRRIEPSMERDAPEVIQVLRRIKDQEHRGYQYEGAEASLELMVCRELNRYQPSFQLERLRIASEQPTEDTAPAYATIKIRVGDKAELTAGEGDGPVHAMDRALKKAMEVFYPELAGVRLTDYKVRVLNAEATASQVRVLIESTDGDTIWRTVGVSTDILEASWQALVDSYEYKLMQDRFSREEA